jgi:hypothetical protein
MHVEGYGWKVFWKRLLRRIFVSDMLDIMCDEEIHNPYYAANSIRIVSSRKMRWAGPVGCMG